MITFEVVQKIMSKKILTIIGARPQIIKASAISRAIRTTFSSELEEIILHTGQHYDENMSAHFFEELALPLPAYNLQVGSGPHGEQTAKMTQGIEGVLLSEKPDALLVYGDTNSTLAGALAASKLGIPVIHVEAGLRSYNKAMPEEINRILCDHVSTLLFCPTQQALSNLKKEGFVNTAKKASIDHPKHYHCGDIMLDNSMYFSTLSDQQSNLLASLDLKDKPFILTTIHRNANTDVPENLSSIFEALNHIQKESGHKIVLPLHPRTKTFLDAQKENKIFEAVMANEHFIFIPPASFLNIIALEKNASMIITDSGGLQKEAYFFKKPCIILREQTEWTEIVESGNALLAGASKERIIAAFQELSNKPFKDETSLFGDGNAAHFICRTLINELSC